MKGEHLTTATAWKHLDTVKEGGATYEYFYRKSGDGYEVTREEDKSGNKTPNTNNLQPLYSASEADLKSASDLAIPGTKDDPKSAEYSLRQIVKSKEPPPSTDNPTSSNSPTYGRNELQLRGSLRPKLGSEDQVNLFMSRFPEGKSRESEIGKYLQKIDAHVKTTSELVAKGDFEGAYAHLEKEADPVTKAFGEEAFGKGCHDAYINHLTNELPVEKRFTPGDAEAAWYSSVEGNEGASLTPKMALNAFTESQKKSPENLRSESHEWYDQHLSGEYTRLDMTKEQTVKRKLFKGFDQNNEGVLSSMQGEYNQAREVKEKTPEAIALRNQWVNESKNTPLPTEEKEAEVTADRLSKKNNENNSQREAQRFSHNSFLDNKRLTLAAKKERLEMLFQERKETKKREEGRTIKEIALRLQVEPKPIEV